MNYLFRLALVTDQWINVAICNGEPDETMSSAAYRMEQQGRFWGFMRPVIDWMAIPWETDHCRMAYESELIGAQYAAEVRAQIMAMRNVSAG